MEDERRRIQEEDGVQEEWYKRAEMMTIAELPEFMRELSEDYAHDYGTICHAIAASALAAAHAFDRGPSGGITGFQAGAVCWQFVTEWGALGTKGAPMRFVDYDKLLYPQYEDHFQKTIKATTWERLQEEAKKRLAGIIAGTTNPAGRVVNHWQNIVDGIVPFDLSVEAKEESCGSE